MSPDTVISENLTLLSMPEIVVKLNSMLNDPECNNNDIGNELSLDPALTVRVLKIVNSALYNLPRQVKNISTAVSMLGITQLRNIILTTSVIKKFQSIPVDLVNMDTFWRHSISCAIAARFIANYCQIKDDEDFFVMGLLHDIGKLVMYLVFPDQSREVLCEMRELKKKSSDADVSHVEKNYFSFSHATLGKLLAQQWNMPESLTIPISEHHLPFSQLTQVEATSILKIADYLSNQIESSISPDESNIIENKCLDVLNINENKLIELQEKTRELLKETISFVYT